MQFNDFRLAKGFFYILNVAAPVKICSPLRFVLRFHFMVAYKNLILYKWPINTSISDVFSDGSILSGACVRRISNDVIQFLRLFLPRGNKKILFADFAVTAPIHLKVTFVWEASKETNKKFYDFLSYLEAKSKTIKSYFSLHDDVNYSSV